jgi:hypothetical protein
MILQADPAPIGAFALDRRSRKRFPLRMGMWFRPAGQRLPVEWTAGESVNLSSTGLLFSSGDRVSPGQQIEALIDWPARLNNCVDLRLAVEGTIVRSAGEKAAMRVDRYEFQLRNPVRPEPKA